MSDSVVTTNKVDPKTPVEEAGLPSVLTAVIAGDFIDAGNSRIYDVEDPATESVIARFAEADTNVVAAAVESAEEAWTTVWRCMAPADRGRILAGVAQGLRDNADVLARLESIDTGKPISQARADVNVSVRYFEYYAGAADKISGLTIPQPPGTFAYTQREPYGVIAHITPWNAPLSQMMRGVAPCLAAGNTVVVKPSELTPLSSILAARIMVEAGLPAGVCNVVPGPGSFTGDQLIRHELVQHITFTGSVSVGRLVGRVAAERIIGCNLELGGKSPTIILEDADLDKAARAGALAIVRNCGQSCFATTRLIVQRSVRDRLLEKLISNIEGLSIGHGLDDPDIGPLVSEAQRRKVTAYLDVASAEGADVVIGGGRPEGQPSGHFIQPTVLSDVTNDMSVAREEIFGPVQSVLAFDDIDEAITMANDTPFGLSAGVFTSNISSAHRIANAVKAGQIQVNRYSGAGVEVPFGGYKNSGLGREKGMEALLHYTQLKSVILSTS